MRTVLRHDLENYPLPLGELISRSWNFFWGHSRQIFPLFIVVYCVIFGGSLLMGGIGAYLAVVAPAYHWIPQMLTGVVAFCVYTLLPIAVSIFVEGRIHEVQITWSDALKLSMERWAPGIRTSIFAVILLTVLVFLLVVPAVIWSIYLIFVLNVVALRHRSGKEAIEYSKSLVKGRWWRVFKVMVVIGLFNLLAAIAVNIPFAFMPDHFVSALVAEFVGGLATAPFVCMSVFYFLNLDYLMYPATPSEVEVSEGQGNGTVER